MRTPFFSRDTKHKVPFGCVAVGETLCLRLLLPADTTHAGVYMLKDGTNKETYYPMQKGAPYKEDSFWWSAHIKFDLSALYFYKFDFICSSHGRVILTRGIRDEAILSKDGRMWQLTVYDRKFKTPEWLDGGVMYQIFPDRFYKSNKTTVNIPEDRYIYESWSGTPSFDISENKLSINNDYWCGNLKGIEEKLPYIAELGVNCIYLNPIFEAHSNHRYNTADYTKIDPCLGTEEDFISLCATAKEHGIHIILDGVFSHTGDDSVYFNSKNRYNSLGAANSQSSPYYHWYSFSKWPEKYNSWWGFKTLPEVNEESPDYINYICGEGGVVEKWLNLGADGFRLDVADELPDAFLDALRAAVKIVKSDAVVIGEVWEDASTKFSYGKRRRYLQGKQLDSVMNYPFYESIVSFMHSKDGEAFIEEILSIVENYPPQVNSVLMNHLGTHDTERLITALCGEPANGRDRNWQSKQFLTNEQRVKGIEAVKKASVLQFALPGVPCIYYGDEIGMEGYRDPFNRAPYEWDNQNEELLAHYKMLGEIRKHPAFRSGVFEPYWFSNGYVSFIRRKYNHCAFVAVNLRDKEKVIDLPADFSNVHYVAGILEGNQVILPPDSFAIVLSK